MRQRGAHEEHPKTAPNDFMHEGIAMDEIFGWHSFFALELEFDNFYRGQIGAAD